MYIVTGGAGLIGSAVVWGLNRRGIEDILVVDHLGNSDKWKNLSALSFSDYMEKEAFRSRLAAGGFNGARIEGVIHMGACSSTMERDASYLIDNNFHATKAGRILPCPEHPFSRCVELCDLRRRQPRLR